MDHSAATETDGGASADQPKALGPAKLTVRFLDVPTLQCNSGRAEVLSGKDAVLLLMAWQPRGLDRAAMLELLWPGRGRATQSGSLRQRAGRLRRRFGHEVLCTGKHPRLATDIAVDLDQFQHALHADPSVADKRLLGHLGFAEEPQLDAWLTDARAYWHARCRETLQLALQAAEAARELARATAYATWLVHDDPLDERLACRLMKLHYLAGDRAAGLQVGEALTEALDTELGLPPGAEARDLLKLLGRPVQLPTSVVRPPQTIHPPALIGREAAWNALVQAQTRRTPAVLLGEAGIGKTRLGQDLFATLDAARTFTARPSDARRGLATIARLVDGLALQPEELEPWVRGELARFDFRFGLPPGGHLAQAAVAMAVGACLKLRGVEHVFIDDLHYADDESLDVLLSLLDQTIPAIVWLLACRSAEVPPALDGWMQRAETTAVQPVVLEPLDPAAVEALLQSLALPTIQGAAWAARLHAHTGGNVLFLLETCALLEAETRENPCPSASPLPIPQAMDALLQRRLGQLSAPALELARLAALCGDEFGVELAAAVLQTSPLGLSSAWQELEGASLLSSGRLRHDTLREALLAKLAAPIALAMHVRIAAVLSTEPSSVASTVVAQHWQAGGQPRQAATWWQRHAVNTGAQGHAREELRARDAEAECWRFSGEHRRFIAAKAQAVTCALHTEGIDAALLRAHELLNSARDEEDRIDAWSAQLQCELMAQRFAAAVETAEHLLPAARRMNRRRELLTATLALAQSKAMLRQGEAGLALLDNAEVSELLREHREPRLEYEFASARSYILRELGRMRASLAATNQAYELVVGLGDDWELLTTVSNRSLQYYDLGMTQLAFEDGERACALRRRLDGENSVLLAVAELNLGAYAISLGRIAEGLTISEQALDRAVGADAVAFACLTRLNLAQVWLFLGQFARAARILGEGGWDQALPIHQFRRQVLRHRLARALGSAPAPEVVAALESPGAVASEPHRCSALVERAFLAPPPVAIALLQEAEVLAEKAQADAQRPRIRALRARLLAGADPLAAAGLARDVAESLHQIWVNDSMPEVWWHCAEAFRLTDQPDRRSEILSQAQQWIRETLMPSTPKEFLPSLRERNPFVRALLAAG